MCWFCAFHAKAPFYLLNFPLYIKPYSQRCACSLENILFFSVFYCHGQRNVRPLLRCTFLSSSWNIYLSRAKCDFSSANCPIWQIYVISESSLQILTLHLEIILTRAFFFKGEVVLCSSCLSGEATFTRNHLTTSHSRQTLRNPESIVGMYLWSVKIQRYGA